MLSRLVASAAKRATSKVTNLRHFHLASIYNSIELKMPSLSPTMTEGTIVKWVKNEGEAVNAGDVVCEIQTDKAVVALEADDDGTLAKIIMPADSGTIKVGALIAVMAEEGEDWTSVESQGVIEEVDANEVVMPTGGGSTPGTEIKMPSLSPTMTEGTIVKWCKAEGEKLSAGDVLCEVQTDKAVVAMEVDDDAILAKILVPEGESGVPVNKLIALTVDEGEDWKDVQIPMIQDQDQGLDTLASTEEKSVQEVTESHVQAVPNAGPAVMLLCAQYGIDPSKVTSTGPKGLLKSDILKHIADNNLSALKITSKSSSAPPPSSPEVEQVKVSSPPPVGQSYVDIPLTSMRSVIAKRLSQSKSTSPHGYSTTQCNIDAINAIRNDLKAVGIKISLNDLIIKAAATALQLVPEVNLNTVGQDDYQVMGNIDIAVAVATPNGLITPIVPNVVDKSLPEISATVRDLAGRAREGKLQLNEFQGGTFTISNLGMFGIKEFTAIINPPQCAIMAVGSGSLEVHPDTGKGYTAMRSTLSFDRRFIDEQVANDFMATFQRVVENPQYMNLGLVPPMRRVTAVEL